MNTTATFYRPTDPTAIAARIHIAHQQRRDAMSRAYLRALRLAEYRAWLAIEPRTSNTPARGKTESVLQGLVFLGLGLIAGTAAVASLITSTPFVLWALQNSKF